MLQGCARGANWDSCVARGECCACARFGRAQMRAAGAGLGRATRGRAAPFLQLSTVSKVFFSCQGDTKQRVIRTRRGAFETRELSQTVPTNQLSKRAMLASRSFGRQEGASDRLHRRPANALLNGKMTRKAKRSFVDLAYSQRSRPLSHYLGSCARPELRDRVQVTTVHTKR